tara:strand:- start:49958 stop:50362 length:405 start_codon:yes stop_codon:yes gene_type:complete
MVSRTASCSCGQLRIEVYGDPVGIGMCHCLECQKRTGSVFASLATFLTPFKVAGRFTEYLRVGDQGTRLRFRFCPVCGSNVFHVEDGDEECVTVAVGALADSDFPKPEVSVYDRNRHPWVALPPNTEAFAKDPL